MKAPAVVLDAGCSAEVTPYQELAGAILRQALIDLQDPSRTVRRSAAEFLQGTETFGFWCDVAGLDAHVIAEYARPLLVPMPTPVSVDALSRFRRRNWRR